MNRDDVIRMAREAASQHPVFKSGVPDPAGEELAVLERFAALVAAAEREECAKLIEPMGDWCGGHGLPRAPTPRECAAAIRARKD